jgi:dihydrofolate reductase
MRKVFYAMSVSLDGFIEAVGGDLSWSFPDEELHQYFNHQEARIDTYLYGRGLYENMSAFWPTADENPSAPQQEIEYARIWKSKPKIVFSKTLDQVGQLGLIDEFRLFFHPVILGGGKPMFQALHDKINLKLIETRTFISGVLLLRYQLAEQKEV